MVFFRVLLSDLMASVLWVVIRTSWGGKKRVASLPVGLPGPGDGGMPAIPFSGKYLGIFLGQLHIDMILLSQSLNRVCCLGMT